eukprot:35387-Chlamydomonas_euryale.AAC.1
MQCGRNTRARLTTRTAATWCSEQPHGASSCREGWCTAELLRGMACTAEQNEVPLGITRGMTGQLQHQLRGCAAAWDGRTWPDWMVHNWTAASPAEGLPSAKEHAWPHGNMRGRMERFMAA